LKTEFLAGTLPSEFSTDFDPYLFNLEKHRTLQAKEGWCSYHLVRKDKKKSLASVYFHVKNGIANSPLLAPFGSFQFSGKLSPKEIFDFISAVESDLKSRHVKKVLIKNPPESYSTTSPLLDVSLLNQGYGVVEAEAGSGIPISKAKLEDRMETWEKRKLRQAERARLSFEVLSPGTFHEVYDFIKHCRVERKQSISMSREGLEKVIRTFPKGFHLFAAHSKNEMAAASISIRINKSVLYNFYSAHPKKFDSLSPVVFLVQGIYNWCRKANVQLLDLGTSAADKKPNFSLLDFKMHLGGIPCRKLTFAKELV